ncbi:MAG: helix-turn-helix transcriptional regulator, partial [Bacteroidales bacterium]|nr:helix-turn-helix transcriptional regulator [Bacteroidales bacterium]
IAHIGEAMKQTLYHMNKENQLTVNLNACREIIFDIRFEDITAMCGIPESTMKSYDQNSNYVSPYLKTAKKLADMYCTTVDRLCGPYIAFHAKEDIDMQIKFINRLGHTDIGACKDAVLSKIKKKGSETTEKFVYKKVREEFAGLIRKSCKEGKYVIIGEDTETCENFTKNFNYLMTLCHLPYKRVSKISGVSEPTLTRLKQGVEPSMPTVIRLADYFGVSIEKFLSPNPRFELGEIKEIIAGTTLKTELTNVYDDYSYEEQKSEERLAKRYISFEEAKTLAEEYLEKIK